jgi:hypothetical protein
MIQIEVSRKKELEGTKKKKEVEDEANRFATVFRAKRQTAFVAQKSGPSVSLIPIVKHKSASPILSQS